MTYQTYAHGKKLRVSAATRVAAAPAAAGASGDVHGGGSGQTVTTIPASDGRFVRLNFSSDGRFFGCQMNSKVTQLTWKHHTSPSDVYRST